MTRIKHNLKLLIISVVLSISLVYIIKNPDLFLSSVLNLQEIQEIEAKQRDIAYKTDNQMLDIFLPLTGFQKDKDHIGQINIAIAYNDDTIHIDPNQATSQVPYVLTGLQSGYFILSFPAVSSIDPNQSLIYIPFSGSNSHILIEDANTSYNNQESSLSIGKLSPTSVHGNQ